MAQQRKISPTETHLDVASLLARAPLIESAAHAAPQPILVVDDHPTNRRLLVRQLAYLGYTADAAANGLEALERFTARNEHETRYALVYEIRDDKITRVTMYLDPTEALEAVGLRE